MASNRDYSGDNSGQLRFQDIRDSASLEQPNVTGLILLFWKKGPFLDPNVPFSKIKIRIKWGFFKPP